MNSIQSGTALQNGKFVLENVLGQGSFGMTYKASMQTSIQGDLGSLKTSINVAVKEFFMNGMNTRGSDGSWVEGSDGEIVQNYRRKFRKEAENLSRLDHPNIVKVLSIFDENNTTYYVMEYLEGESLDQRIARIGRLEEYEAISVIRQVGSALQHMHRHQMLHLDLKPGNVMCANDGRTVLIDFGLSKQYDEKGEPESSTTLGLGTKGYAPIEQADYRQDGTFPATLDIYALGATFFKTLTGIRPLSASELLNDDSFLQRNLGNAGVSTQVSDVVCKAMAYRRKDRFQTVEEFLQALPSPDSLHDEKTELASLENEETELPRPLLTPHSGPEPESPIQEEEVESTPSWEPSWDTTPKPNDKPNKGLVVVIIVAFLVALSFLLYRVIVIKNKPINVVGMWTKEGYWTGSATHDSVMDGRGELSYFYYDIDGRSTYTGEMKEGHRNGEGVLLYKNGTKFYGTFENDTLVFGEYSIPAEDSRFYGSFRNNLPYNGEWYYISTDILFAKVIDGKTNVIKSNQTTKTKKATKTNKTTNSNDKNDNDNAVDKAVSNAAKDIIMIR